MPGRASGSTHYYPAGHRAAAASAVFLCDAIAITHPIRANHIHHRRHCDDNRDRFVHCGGPHRMLPTSQWQLRYRRNETIVARGAVRPVMPEQDGKAITSTAATGCGCGSSGTSNVGMMLGVVLLLMCVKHRGACDRHHRR